LALLTERGEYPFYDVYSVRGVPERESSGEDSVKIRLLYLNSGVGCTKTGNTDTLRCESSSE